MPTNASPLAALLSRDQSATKVKIMVSDPNAATRSSTRTSTLCSSDQVNIVKQAILDLGTLAEAAKTVLALANNDIVQLEPVQTFLGDIDGVEALNSLVNLRYSNVQNFWAGIDKSLVGVQAMKPGDGTLYLYCAAAADAYCKSSYAFTILLHESQHSLNALQTTDLSNILEDLPVRDSKQDSDSEQDSESEQDSDSEKDSDSEQDSDSKEEPIKAVTPKTCTELDPEKRSKNAENIALLAFVAHADRDRFDEPLSEEKSDPDCADGTDLRARSSTDIIENDQFQTSDNSIRSPAMKSMRRSPDLPGVVTLENMAQLLPRCGSRIRAALGIVGLGGPDEVLIGS
ncbi:hypothetical protein C8R43DRAFT_960939 [Mycena crocata]|nr:hypothetical protein C8R43DRAFT_960939 [Mycena crocata]